MTAPLEIPPLETRAEYKERRAREHQPGPRDDGPRDIPPFTDEARSNWAPDSGDPRPRIALSKNNIEKIVNQAEAALVKADRGVYQRDGRIVSVERVKDFAADGVEVRVQRIGERDDYALQEDLSSAAAFQKFDRRENKSMAADPPMAIVKTLQARRDRLQLPVLTGVLNAPTMRADGSLLTEPGYDSKTGLLFEPLDETFQPIPQRPSPADARKALDKLNALIRDFPFVEDKHRAVALSAILTAPIRRSLPSAPAHAFTAPVAGTGKSKIVDTASIIATGAEAPATGAGKDEEELEKRLASSLLVADPIINIDNVARPIGGDLLCQMLTQATVKPRILGKSKNPTCTTGTFVGLTGNNLVLVGDLTRRAIICRLDARMERPELRAFDFDPVADAKKGRAEYVAAVLTILRAYHVAGRPNRPKPLGSFEAWSELVRGALLWLGCADPVDTMEEIREADPALAQLQAVMGARRSRWKT
jgi:hypothetical protein